MKEIKRDQIERVVTRMGKNGGTAGEITTASGINPGTVSGQLSILHSRGRLARLEGRRDGKAIYVAPQFVGGRATVGRVPSATPEPVVAAPVAGESDDYLRGWRDCAREFLGAGR
jgi:hypothetical protein